jgi:cytochrome P450
MWVPLTHDTVNEVAYDTDRFTSRSVVVSVGRPGDLALPGARSAGHRRSPATPVPQHGASTLLPAFARSRSSRGSPRSGGSARRCSTRSARSPRRDVIDAAVNYAQNIPVSVIGRMLGFPAEDEALFRKFVHDVLERIAEEPGTREGMDDLGIYITAQIQEHRENPRDDLTTFLMNVEFDGQPVSDEIAGGMIILLLIAGIDTTWSAIGSSLWHLAQHPEDRQRLLDDPEVMTFALEEFLRAYAPVTMARMVAKDTDFHGCPMKKDDYVLLPFPAANRDPAQVRGPGHVRRRPPGEPPRRVRAGHPPLPGLQPRSPRAEGRDRRVHQAISALRARR